MSRGQWEGVLLRVPLIQAWALLAGCLMILAAYDLTIAIFTAWAIYNQD